MTFTWLFSTVLLICININIICTATDNSDANFPFLPKHWAERVMEQIKEKKQIMSIMTRTSISDDSATCIICNLVVTALLEEKSLGMTNVQLSSEAEYFCEILGIEDTTVCEGVVTPNVDPLSYIVENKEVTSKEICSMLLECELGQDSFEWTIDIPEGTTVDKVESTGEKTFKIGHITDIHYDPNYTEGKVLACNEPVCCQADQANASSGEESCGYWGSSENADSPLRLVEEALDQMVNQDLDYVYFTGDLVAHRVWGTSVTYNSDIITTIMDLFASKFKDVPVYPILGNHEIHPVNVYAPLNVTDDNIASQWLYDLVVEKWALSDDTVKETILKGGYYTVKPRDGFRVIVLNNNVCSRQNWWNLYENNDPYGQLKWLVETLEAAEQNKEIVHILYHMPTSSCLKSWGREYNRIIERFSNTIAAQFNGHTHRDQFTIHFNDDSTPIGVTLNGGSLMPDLASPNYKVYHVDATGYDVIDFDTYTFDLQAANDNKKIEWVKLYSFKESFGVKSLIPSELKTLVFESLNKDADLTQLYHNYYFRNSTKGQKECDTDCQTKLLCEILTTVHGETKQCDSLTTI